MQIRYTSTPPQTAPDTAVIHGHHAPAQKLVMLKHDCCAVTPVLARGGDALPPPHANEAPTTSSSSLASNMWAHSTLQAPTAMAQ